VLKRAERGDLVGGRVPGVGREELGVGVSAQEELEGGACARFYQQVMVRVRRVRQDADLDEPRARSEH
jgi:hypothetical protein